MNTNIRDMLENRLTEFVALKKTGKITIEINISQGGIGQTFIETKETIPMKR